MRTRARAAWRLLALLGLAGCGEEAEGPVHGVVWSVRVDASCKLPDLGQWLAIEDGFEAWERDCDAAIGRHDDRHEDPDALPVVVCLVHHTQLQEGSDTSYTGFTVRVPGRASIKLFALAPDDHLTTVATHEMGHVLNWSGDHAPPQSGIMSPSAYGSTLTAADFDLAESHGHHCGE